MKNIDDEFLTGALGFMDQAVADDKPFFVWHNTTRMHMHTHLPDEYAGKTGFGLYADGMAQMDDHIGVLLNKLDELGVADNTIVMFATDNGAAANSWPDGGNTPFRGEKGTTWEGGFRIPVVVKWPGHIPAGSVCTDFVALEDWRPTLMAAVGEPDIKEKLLAGHTVGDKTFNVHLDGYDQTDAITGKGPGKRKEFFYFAEITLQAVRYGDWKFHFVTQDKWFNGVKEELVTPLTINLKLDPFERFTEARGFDEWQEDRAFTIGPIMGLVGNFIQTFAQYPPRQEGFTPDVNALMAKVANGSRQ